MYTKKCRNCDIEKPLTEFYKHKGMFDGYLNKCKECVKNRVSYYRIENIDKVREYDRNRPNAEKRSIENAIRIKNLSDDDKKKYKKVKDRWSSDGFNKNKKTVEIK